MSPFSNMPGMSLRLLTPVKASLTLSRDMRPTGQRLGFKYYCALGSFVSHSNITFSLAIIPSRHLPFQEAHAFQLRIVGVSLWEVSWSSGHSSSSPPESSWCGFCLTASQHQHSRALSGSFLGLEALGTSGTLLTSFTRTGLFISQRLCNLCQPFELWQGWKHWGNTWLGWFMGANWLPMWLQKQIPHTQYIHLVWQPQHRF